MLALAGCTGSDDEGAVPSTSPTTTTASSPECESDGLLVDIGVVDAAMGERQAPLIATACGSSPVQIDQLATLEAGDEEGSARPIHVEPQQSQQPITLQPGQQATAIINWHNTTQSGTAANAAYLDIVVVSGGPVHRVVELIDTGTTGQVKLYAWQAS